MGHSLEKIGATTFSFVDDMNLLATYSMPTLASVGGLVPLNQIDL